MAIKEVVYILTVPGVDILKAFVPYPLTIGTSLPDIGRQPALGSVMAVFSVREGCQKSGTTLVGTVSIGEFVY